MRTDLLRKVGRGADFRSVDRLARMLEKSSRAVDFRDPTCEKALVGRWKLVYSSSLPGSRKESDGITVGDAYQIIFDAGERVDHEVVFRIVARGVMERFFLPLLPSGIEGATLNAVLRHKGRVQPPRTMTITLESVVLGLDKTWIELPSLPQVLEPPEWTRSSTFDVTYLDDNLRISRGDRGEIRVFTKESSSVGPTR